MEAPVVIERKHWYPKHYHKKDDEHNYYENGLTNLCYMIWHQKFRWCHPGRQRGCWFGEMNPNCPSSWPVGGFGRRRFPTPSNWVRPEKIVKEIGMGTRGYPWWKIEKRYHNLNFEGRFCIFSVVFYTSLVLYIHYYTRNNASEVVLSVVFTRE